MRLTEHSTNSSQELDSRGSNQAGSEMGGCNTTFLELLLATKVAGMDASSEMVGEFPCVEIASFSTAISFGVQSVKNHLSFNFKVCQVLLSRHNSRSSCDCGHVCIGQ